MDGLQDVNVKHLNGKDVDNVGQMVIKIWEDAAIQASLKSIRSLTFEDDLVYQSAAMFQHEFDRIFTESYMPTDEVPLRYIHIYLSPSHLSNYPLTTEKLYQLRNCITSLFV